MNAGEYLEHHGILGQRWGVRRFQNPDGSLIKDGAKRYGSSNQTGKTNKQIENRLNDLAKGMAYNERDVRDSYRTINAIKNKYAKKTKDSGFDPDKALVTNNLSKRDAKILEKAKTKNKEAEKRIKEGQKEIDSILKDCGNKNINVEVKEIKRDTTRGKENVGLALAVVGSIPLAVLPGPNAVGVASVLAVSKVHKENTVDSMAFKVKNDKNQSENARRNAAEQLRYGDGKKSRQLAEKEISKMSDKDLVSEAKNWRESAEYHRKNGDNDTAKQWERNAKLYEKEINRRSYDGYNKIPKKAPKDPNERRKIIEEATKQANGGKPYNSMSEYADAYRKIGKEINDRWNSK